MLRNALSRFAICLVPLVCVAGIYAQQSTTGSQPPTPKKSEQVTPPQSQSAAPSGQKKSDDPQGPITILKTEVVTLSVTVTDPYNRLVTGLDRQHFEVFEDKVKQDIEFFKDEDVPVSVGIIFDVSGSMKGKLDRAREALKAFIQTSHDMDDFFLVGFNQRANLVAEFTDGDNLINKLTLIDPKGQTALYDAAYLGIEKVKQGRHQKRAILLISDGQDNSSRYTYGELRKLLKEANVQIYSIGIVEMGGGAGSTLDLQGQGILEEVSQTTGGKAFFPRSAAELEDATTRIALELRHQYSIGYVPTNEKRDGKWRKISVKVSPPRGMPRLNVRSKEGYYAIPQ
ncbi:MAG: VWA domain-containing protein [Acidobacteria bacterium]|nr:VWA domain-containing protein [Acidobacteriota bacterium]